MIHVKRKTDVSVPARLCAALVAVLLVAGTAAGARRLSISAAVANIRSGPGTGHDVLWQAERYYPLLILKKIRSWYQFRDFEGEIGWVHESLVGNAKTLITQSPVCNVRSGPGTGNPVLFTVEAGVPFKVIGRKGPWFQVEHADGDRGWIHRSLTW